MRLLAPLLDTMTLVLLAAALVSGLIGDLADTVVIAVIVVLNTVISAVQEWQADQALAALQRLATHDAQVRRDGRWGRCRRTSWCRATWCCWRPATRCPPTCACTRWPSCGPMNPP
jgi:magnesium-transporting ATPase (P-type)